MDQVPHIIKTPFREVQVNTFTGLAKYVIPAGATKSMHEQQEKEKISRFHVKIIKPDNNSLRNQEYI